MSGIPKSAVMRVARPTDHLEQVSRMYMEGLGFERLGEFNDHAGFDGVILGHARHHYHLEFTCHRGTQAGRAPTQDNLLVFYLPDKSVWAQCCRQMEAAGFTPVQSYNPYWDLVGKTFEDVDGYRVVLQNEVWEE